MTTTTETDATRTAATAILRAVADLIETRPDIPVPGASIDFYLHGEDAPATMAAIAAALPCQWRASVTRSGGYEWLNLRSDGLSASVSRGARVQHRCACRRHLRPGRGQDGHGLAARRGAGRAARQRAGRRGGVMTKTHLTAAVLALLFLRWLATMPRAAAGRRDRHHRARARRRGGDRYRGGGCPGGADRLPDPGRAGHARGLAGAEGGSPMTAVAMTKTEALRIARRARRYGHQADRNDPRAVVGGLPAVQGARAGDARAAAGQPRAAV